MIWPMSTDTPHLRLMPPEEVNAFCDRAERLTMDSYTVRLESNAFRVSRTPWDATRLANALWHYEKGNATIEALVRDIDAAAEACAGLVPANRHPERL